jgi:hypothetical protein
MPTVPASLTGATRVINDYVTALAMQESAYFESAEARIFAQPLHGRLTQGAVELLRDSSGEPSHAFELDTQGVSRVPSKP